MEGLWKVCLIPTAISPAFVLLSSGYPDLEEYEVNEDYVCVSGCSAGGAMAVQFHVAMSSRVMGLGVMAGIPYGCAGAFGFMACIKQPNLITTASLISVADTASNLGTIDNTSHLDNDRVFIYHGKNDTVVNIGVGKKIEEFYQHFTGNTVNVKTEYNVSSQHGVERDCCHLIALADNWNSANIGFHEKVTQCESSSGFQSRLIGISEDTDTEKYQMGISGVWLIVCKLHIVFHGCKQGRQYLEDSFVRHAGYNEVGELNNIIILYPQVTSTSTVNPYGCWDWWGYTGQFYGKNYISINLGPAARSGIK